MTIIITTKKWDVKIFRKSKEFKQNEETTGICDEKGKIYTFKNNEISSINIENKETRKWKNQYM